MTFDEIARIPLTRIALAGLAVSGAMLLLHPAGLVEMARTWPPALFAASLAWRLSRLPAMLVMAALVVRGAVRSLS